MIDYHSSLISLITITKRSPSQLFISDATRISTFYHHRVLFTSIYHCQPVDLQQKYGVVNHQTWWWRRTAIPSWLWSPSWAPLGRGHGGLLRLDAQGLTWKITSDQRSFAEREVCSGRGSQLLWSLLVHDAHDMGYHHNSITHWMTVMFHGSWWLIPKLRLPNHHHYHGFRLSRVINGSL